jgi:fumarate hydratase, class I
MGNKSIKTPLDAKVVGDIRAGDTVLLSGIIYTGRDAFHKFLFENKDASKLPIDLRGAVIYHCGPIVVKESDGWRVAAAGPTTSYRTSPYIPEIVRRYGVRGFIGKGGLSPDASSSLKQYGAVYLSAVGGCAQVLAESIVKVIDVYYYKEFGPPEAVWKLQVRDFPLLVTIDAHGKDIHREVAEASAAARNKFR